MALRRRGVSMSWAALNRKQGISHTGTNEAPRRCCSTMRLPEGSHRCTGRAGIARKFGFTLILSLSLLGAEESWSILEVYTRQG